MSGDRRGARRRGGGRGEPSSNVCSFFNSKQGCRAGDKCRFLHTTLAAPPPAEKIAPPATLRLAADQRRKDAAAPAAASSTTETPPEIAPSGPWDGLLFELRGAALEANCGPQLDGAALEANLEQQRAEADAREATRHGNQAHVGAEEWQKLSSD